MSDQEARAHKIAKKFFPSVASLLWIDGATVATHGEVADHLVHSSAAFTTGERMLTTFVPQCDWMEAQPLDSDFKGGLDPMIFLTKCFCAEGLQFLFNLYLL